MRFLKKVFDVQKKLIHQKNQKKIVSAKTESFYLFFFHEKNLGGQTDKFWQKNPKI